MLVCASEPGLRRLASDLRLAAVAASLALFLLSGESTAQDLEHPAAWGDTHVGDPLPAYSVGKDCLFCHRRDIQPGWPSNPHRLSVRPADPDSASIVAARESFLRVGLALDAQAVLGGRSVMRFLRPNGKEGQLSILTSSWRQTEEPSGKLIDTTGAHWDETLYGARCAGCHSSGVETRSRSFSDATLDCFSCHGSVPTQHSSDPALALLAVARDDAPRVVVSVCGRCHVRSGRSLSTGRPYPNQFVPGDNLFRDFSMDFSDEALARTNPMDRHVLENVRDVAVYGESVTCLSCHDVHAGASEKHRQVESADRCLTCHERDGDRWMARSYEISSSTCQYGAEWELAKIEQARQEEEARLAAGQSRVVRAIRSFLALDRVEAPSVDDVPLPGPSAPTSENPQPESMP